MAIVPNAKDALNRYKMEAAREVGVNLKDGYNGDLTSRQVGSVGGQMVKIVWPVRTMKFERVRRWEKGHSVGIMYAVEVAV